MTILISSHELSEIEGVASHVAFLDEGKLLFEETMSDLTARFRQVRVTLDRTASPSGHAPAEWLNVRTAGNVLMFVDSRYSEGHLDSGIATLNGSVRSVDTQPMALRSIFTALARAAREVKK
jgi:ABC-2 type transport system ATP-binding protein